MFYCRRTKLISKYDISFKLILKSFNLILMNLYLELLVPCAKWKTQIINRFCHKAGVLKAVVYLRYIDNLEELNVVLGATQYI